jgi:DMSO/TMAO reductase YedYZ molybdopterin-dependent catalytic subunit
MDLSRRGLLAATPTAFVTTIYVTNQQPKGFWTDRGYNWFSGI